jgi:hypothetical protein
MLGKAAVASVAAILWALTPLSASAGYYCYDHGAVVGSARCAGIGLGLHSPRWYYSDDYPYWIYFRTEGPYVPSGNLGTGCYLIERPVLDPRWGWVKRTQQVCD